MAAPAQVKRDKNALTRKLGPLPAWAWAIAGGGALYLYRNRGAASSSAPNPDVQSGAPQGVNPDTGLPWNINPDTGLPYGTGDGAGDTSGGTSDTSGDTGTGDKTPAGGGLAPTPETGTTPAPKKKKPKAKKPRRPRIRIPRRPKAKGPKHGGKGHPPHKPHKPKRPKRGAGSKPHRDRKGVHAGAPHTHGVGAKPRRRGAKAASSYAGDARTLASHRAGSRAPSVAHPQGGRGHEGGQDHNAGGRPRVMPKAQGANRRARPLAHPSSKAPLKPRTEPAPKHEAAPRASSRGSRAAQARRRK